MFSFWLCPPPENINSIELKHVNAVLRSKSVSPPCVDLLELIFLSPSPLSLVSVCAPYLRLVLFDLLQGSHQSFGCRALAQPLGCCCSNGRCGILEPAGTPRSSSRTPPAPSPSPIARPASQPRHPETRPRAHPHHPRANPLLTVLTHHRLTSASQEQPLKKHTVKKQT